MEAGTGYQWYAKLSDGVNTTQGPNWQFSTQGDEAPSGNININNGKKYTNNTEVDLNISASDKIDQSSSLNMMVANKAGFSDGEWEPFQKSKKILLNPSSGIIKSGIDGEKNVYIKFKDSSGLVSKVQRDTIYLDKTRPTGWSTLRVSKHITASKSLTFTFEGVDNTKIMYMRFSNNSLKWSQWEAFRTKKLWNLLNSKYGGNNQEGSKNVYFQFKDIANNYSQVMRSGHIIYNPRKVNILKLTKFHYNAQGIDHRNLNDEYLILENNLKGILRLEKWYLKNKYNIKYVFPVFVLPAKGRVVIYTGKGHNTSRRLYMNIGAGMWSNYHDTLRIYTYYKQLILINSY